MSTSDYRWIYEAWFYARALLLVAAIILAAGWQTQKGKGLLCACLGTSLLAALLSQLPLLARRIDAIDLSYSARPHSEQILSQRYFFFFS